MEVRRPAQLFTQNPGRNHVIRGTPGAQQGVRYRGLYKAADGRYRSAGTFSTEERALAVAEGRSGTPTSLAVAEGRSGTPTSLAVRQEASYGRVLVRLVSARQLAGVRGRVGRAVPTLAHTFVSERASKARKLRAFDHEFAGEPGE